MTEALAAGRHALRRASTSTSTARAATSTGRCAVYGQEGRPCPRCGTPIRRDAVHEPVVVLLPPLPAASSRPASVIFTELSWSCRAFVVLQSFRGPAEPSWSYRAFVVLQSLRGLTVRLWSHLAGENFTLRKKNLALGAIRATAIRAKRPEGLLRVARWGGSVLMMGSLAPWTDPRSGCWWSTITRSSGVGWSTSSTPTRR